MNSALRISARVEIDASQAPQAVAQVNQAVASIGNEADRTTTKLQRLVNSSVGLNTGTANQNMREWTGALAAQGKSIDDLRAKYNPLFAVIREYKSNVTEIRTLHAQQVLSTNEMTAAIQRNRQATLASIDAIKGRNLAIAAGGDRAGNSFAAQNAMYQFQDIGVTAAMGMNPLMIGLQQGSQIGGAYAGMGLKEAAATTASAIGGLFSPVSLAAVGLTALTATAIQYFTTSSTEADKASKSLEKHGELVRRLRESYGDAIVGAKEYAAESRKILTQDTADTTKNYLELANKSAQTMINGGRGGWRRLFGEAPLSIEDYEGNTEIIGKMQGALSQLRTSVTLGRPDITAFVEKLIEIENHPAVPEKVKEMAQELRGLAAEGIEAQRALATLDETARRLGARQRGPLLGSQDEYDRLDYLDSQRLSLSQMRAAAAARSAALYARSPQERAEAARQQAALDKSGSADEYNLRVETAGREALASAEKELADARRDRIRSLETSVASQQLELSLIGKTASEAERLRTAFQLENQLREQAAQNNVAVDEKELALIREKAAELGRLAQLRASASLLADAQFARDQLGRNSVDQGIASQLRSAGLAVDLNSYEAGILRSNEALRQQIATWEEIRNTGRDAIGDIVDSAAEGFEDIDDVLKNISKSIVKQLLTLGVTNPITNSLYGDNKPTTGLNGIGGFFGALTGRSASPAAVNDNRVGGFSGLANAGNVRSSGSAVDLASGLLGLNENTNGSQINSFLKQGGVDINAARTAWCAGFVNSALKQVGVDGSGSQVANSFLNWGSAVDPSQVLKGDVLVQSRGLGADATGGHVGFATGASRMFGGQQQLQMLSGNSADSVTNSWINASELQIRRATEASSALASMAGNTNVAAQGLGTLGNGFNSFGSALSSVQGGGASGGGFFSSLLGGIGKLFGGVSPTSSLWAPNTTLSAVLGLADGGPVVGPGGPRDDRIPIWASNGEFMVNARAAAAHRPWLEAINSNKPIGAFADGGTIGSVAPVYAGAWRGNGSFGGSSARNAPIINNYTSSDVKYEETTDERGNKQPIITFGEAAAASVKQRGNPMRRAMTSEFNVKPRKVAR